MEERVLFFKAKRKGLDAVMGDLFEASSTVAGHMRGSTYVAPYQATRKKKREKPVSKPKLEPVQLSYRNMDPVNRGKEYRAHYAGAVAKISKVHTAYVASIYTGTNNSYNGLYGESARTLKEAKEKIGRAMAGLVADGTLTPAPHEPHQVGSQPDPATPTLTPGDVVRYSDTGVDFGNVIYQGPHEQAPKTLAWVKTQDGRLIPARWDGLVRVPAASAESKAEPAKPAKPASPSNPKMKKFTVHVDSGYGEFEYKTEIEAESVHAARKKWKEYAAPSDAASFRVSRKKGSLIEKPETYASRCLLTVRRPNGTTDVVDYTALTGKRVMNDTMFAKIKKDTAEAGRGEVISYKNERKEVKEYEMTDADKADRDYVRRRRSIEKMSGGGEAGSVSTKDVQVMTAKPASLPEKRSVAPFTAKYSTRLQPFTIQPTDPPELPDGDALVDSEFYRIKTKIPQRDQSAYGLRIAADHYRISVAKNKSGELYAFAEYPSGFVQTGDVVRLSYSRLSNDAVENLRGFRGMNTAMRKLWDKHR